MPESSLGPHSAYAESPSGPHTTCAASSSGPHIARAVSPPLGPRTTFIRGAPLAVRWSTTSSDRLSPPRSRPRTGVPTATPSRLWRKKTRKISRFQDLSYYNLVKISRLRVVNKTTLGLRPGADTLWGLGAPERGQWSGVGVAAANLKWLPL